MSAKEQSTELQPDHFEYGNVSSEDSEGEGGVVLERSVSLGNQRPAKELCMKPPPDHFEYSNVSSEDSEGEGGVLLDRSVSPRNQRTAQEDLILKMLVHSFQEWRANMKEAIPINKYLYQNLEQAYVRTMKAYKTSLARFQAAEHHLQDTEDQLNKGVSELSAAHEAFKAHNSYSTSLQDIKSRDIEIREAMDQIHNRLAAAKQAQHRKCAALRSAYHKSSKACQCAVRRKEEDHERLSCLEAQLEEWRNVGDGTRIVHDGQ
ncbi:hypothetical protein MMC28_008105 [Mycoblastus sanguinarius]|nr:hypothetical protein [Mycoblastus sanguinarius]